MKTKEILLDVAWGYGYWMRVWREDKAKGHEDWTSTHYCKGRAMECLAIVTKYMPTRPHLRRKVGAEIANGLRPRKANGEII